MDIVELKKELASLGCLIDKLIKKTEFNDYDDLSGIESNHDDIAIQSELIMYVRVMDKLSTAKNIIDYLRKPIVEVSVLHKNDRGRYETTTGFDYTCGMCIEYFNDEGCVARWERSRVEFANDDYYIVGYHKKLDGVKIKRR